MRPQPKARKTTITIPKAGGPDPALIGASSPGTASGASASSDAGKSGRAVGRRKGQLAIWMDADTLGRARTAWRAQNAADLDRPYQTFGQWVAAIIEQAVTDAERRFGQRFDPTPPGQIGHSNPHH